MVRHLVKHVVKLGHRRDFLAAAKALNDAAPRLGLPTYRFWSSQFGQFGVIYGEADYASANDHLERLGAAAKDEAWAKVFRDFTSHLVDGLSEDTLVTEEDLGSAG